MSLEDKILNGGRRDNYCSSSEDENDDGGWRKSTDADRSDAPPQPTVNTGPKGVIGEWRRYKQLQAEHNAEDEREIAVLAQRLSLTCRTYKDDERAKLDEAAIEALVEEEDDDDRAAVRAFMQRRIEEMRAAMSRRQFGTVFDLSDADAFLKATDDDSKFTTVLVHIYEPSVRLCEHIDKHWHALADKYIAFKFVRIRASALNTSRAFQRGAVPTIQVYRNKQLVGNIVALCTEYGDEISFEELEQLLQQYRLLSIGATQHINNADD